MAGKSKWREQVRFATDAGTIVIRREYSARVFIGLCPKRAERREPTVSVPMDRDMQLRVAEAIIDMGSVSDD